MIAAVFLAGISGKNGLQIHIIAALTHLLASIWRFTAFPELCIWEASRWKLSNNSGGELEQTVFLPLGFAGEGKHSFAEIFLTKREVQAKTAPFPALSVPLEARRNDSFAEPSSTLVLRDATCLSIPPIFGSWPLLILVGESSGMCAFPCAPTALRRDHVQGFPFGLFDSRKERESYDIS